MRPQVNGQGLTSLFSESYLVHLVFCKILQGRVGDNHDTAVEVKRLLEVILVLGLFVFHGEYLLVRGQFLTSYVGGSTVPAQLPGCSSE
jgi:hypothetical protein